MIDFNLVLFVILLVVNIMLCIVKVPVFGLAIGFLTIVMAGFVFMNDVLINVYFSELLIVIAFISIIINGFDVRKK